MPQLDIVYIFTVFLWTWLMLHLMMQKINSLMIKKVPTTPPPTKPHKLTLTLPWT